MNVQEFSFDVGNTSVSFKVDPKSHRVRPHYMDEHGNESVGDGLTLQMMENVLEGLKIGIKADIKRKEKEVGMKRITDRRTLLFKVLSAEVERISKEFEDWCKKNDNFCIDNHQNDVYQAVLELSEAFSFECQVNLQDLNLTSMQVKRYLGVSNENWESEFNLKLKENIQQFEMHKIISHGIEVLRS